MGGVKPNASVARQRQMRYPSTKPRSRLDTAENILHSWSVRSSVNRNAHVLILCFRLKLAAEPWFTLILHTVTPVCSFFAFIWFPLSSSSWNQIHEVESIKAQRKELYHFSTCIGCKEQTAQVVQQQAANEWPQKSLLKKFISFLRPCTKLCTYYKCMLHFCFK